MMLITPGNKKTFVNKLIDDNFKSIGGMIYPIFVTGAGRFSTACLRRGGNGNRYYVQQ
jgi:hypothetical protein